MVLIKINDSSNTLITTNFLGVEFIADEYGFVGILKYLRVPYGKYFPKSKVSVGKRT